jgi:phage FluMu protein Com
MKIKIKCNVCDKSPVHTLPNPESVSEGTEVLCSSCNKWLATASMSSKYHIGVYRKKPIMKWSKVMEWEMEDDTYYDEDKDVMYKNYPVEYISS